MKQKIFLLATSTLLFIQCQKEPLITPSDHGSPAMSMVDTHIENGMLVFSDYPSFDSTMEILYEYSISGLDDWEQSMGFTSMRTRFWPRQDTNTELNSMQTQSQTQTQIQVQTMDTSAQPIEDCWLATVLTPEGFIKIADTVYRFTKDTTYSYVDGELVTSFPIVRRLINRTSELGILSCSDEADYDYNVYTTSYEYTSDNGVVETYTWALRFSFFYASTGVTVTHYRETPYYFQGSWSTYLKETPADFLSLQWLICSIEGYWGYPQSHIGSIKESGKSRITQVIRKVAFADVGIKGLYTAEYNNDSNNDQIVIPHYYGL